MTLLLKKEAKLSAVSQLDELVLSRTIISQKRCRQNTKKADLNIPSQPLENT